MKPALFNLRAIYVRYRSSGWKMLQKWGIVLFGLGAAQGATALAVILVASRVTAVEYGQYLACYGLASLLVILPNLGLESWLLASGHLSAEQTAGRWQNALRLRVIALSAWLLCLLIVSLRLPQATFPFGVLLPTALGVAFDSLTLLSNTAWRVMDRHGRVTAVQTIGAVVLCIATLLAPITYGRLSIFVEMRLLISALTFLAALILSPGALRQPAAASNLRHLLKASRAFTLADIATSIYLKADLTIVSFFLGASAASVYGPALNFTNLCFMASQGLYLAAMPNLARSFLSAKPRFLKSGMLHLLAQACAGFFIAAVMFWLAPWLIQFIYGNRYQAAGIALRWMSPLIFIKSLNFGLGALLTSSGHQNQRSAVQFIAH